MPLVIIISLLCLSYYLLVSALLLTNCTSKCNYAKSTANVLVACIFMIENTFVCVNIVGIITLLITALCIAIPCYDDIFTLCAFTATIKI